MFSHGIRRYNNVHSTAKLDALLQLSFPVTRTALPVFRLQVRTCRKGVSARRKRKRKKNYVPNRLKSGARLAFSRTVGARMYGMKRPVLERSGNILLKHRKVGTEL